MCVLICVLNLLWGCYVYLHVSLSRPHKAFWHDLLHVIGLQLNLFGKFYFGSVHYIVRFIKKGLLHLTWEYNVNYFIRIFVLIQNIFLCCVYAMKGKVIYACIPCYLYQYKYFIRKCSMISLLLISLIKNTYVSRLIELWSCTNTKNVGIQKLYVL